jgi:hypothetical protein
MPVASAQHDAVSAALLDGPLFTFPHFEMRVFRA